MGSSSRGRDRCRYSLSNVLGLRCAIPRSRIFPRCRMSLSSGRRMSMLGFLSLPPIRISLSLRLSGGYSYRRMFGATRSCNPVFFDPSIRHSDVVRGTNSAYLFLFPIYILGRLDTYMGRMLQSRMSLSTRCVTGLSSGRVCPYFRSCWPLCQSRSPRLSCLSSPCAEVFQAGCSHPRSCQGGLPSLRMSGECP